MKPVEWLRQTAEEWCPHIRLGRAAFGFFWCGFDPAKWGNMPDFTDPCTRDDWATCPLNKEGVK